MKYGCVKLLRISLEHIKKTFPRDYKSQLKIRFPSPSFLMSLKLCKVIEEIEDTHFAWNRNIDSFEKAVYETLVECELNPSLVAELISSLSDTSHATAAYVLNSVNAVLNTANEGQLDEVESSDLQLLVTHTFNIIKENWNNTNSFNDILESAINVMYHPVVIKMAESDVDLMNSLLMVNMHHFHYYIFP
jgi:hypothetical protein